jgi:hypothetical protein
MRLDKFAGDSRRRRRIRVQSDTLHQLHDHVVQVGGDPAGRRQTSAPAECTPASFDVELLHVILVFSASSPHVLSSSEVLATIKGSTLSPHRAARKRR